MTHDLQLWTGPYRTTFVGTEITRVSTKDEWRNYGEILKRVDEAKQWAIGDWLVDGKNHYGDGLYEEAEKVSGVPYRTLENLKQISDKFEITRRHVNLSWSHHYEVSSLKTIEIDDDDKAYLSKTPHTEKIQEFLDTAEKKKLSVRDLRQQVQNFKRDQKEYIRLANEPEKYPVLYADPPWKYNDELIEGYGAVIHHYSPMSIGELCKLPVRNIVASDAVLFLWVTSPFLNEVWPVVNAWGFQYKSSFIWDKVKHNYGHYNSVRHEILLICTKGSFLPQNNELFDSVQGIERSDEHSEKPEEFRQIIDEMYPKGKRIELFARKEVEGWDSWGNEL